MDRTATAVTMGESILKEDPLSRIQREIIEVTEREKEFKEGHFRINRLLSESTIEVGKQNGLTNGTGYHTAAAPATLSRAFSSSQLLGPTSPASAASLAAAAAAAAPLNGHGYTRRFTPQGGTKGIMQRFIASKGKMQIGSPAPAPLAPPILDRSLPSLFTAAPPAAEPAAVARTPEGRPLRKGYVPVEEKIQKELREMKDREHELKRMRRRRRPFDIELSDEESGSESESEEEEAPPPGPLKVAKSIGELYEARSLGEEARTPSPRSSAHDSLGSGSGSLKPAKSLAELCDLSPGQEFLAPSSTRLIAKWESLIQQKQEAGAA